MPNELKPIRCKCHPSIIFVDSLFLFIPLFYTVECLVCGKKARGITRRKAIENWNRRADND